MKYLHYYLKKKNEVSYENIRQKRVPGREKNKGEGQDAEACLVY